MGTPIYTRGAFAIKRSERMKAGEAARKAVAEAWGQTHTPAEPWVTWPMIKDQAVSMFFRCGLNLVECDDKLIKGTFVSYGSMKLNSWATLVLNALEPYLEEGTGILFYSPEDGLEWQELVHDGVITPFMHDPADWELRPCCPLLM